jgi:phosphate transport system ATP-binding protein
LTEPEAIDFARPLKWADGDHTGGRLAPGRERNAVIRVAERGELRTDNDASERAEPCLAAHGLNAYFGQRHVVKDVTLGLALNTVTAIIGPSGCGKSTLLRCLNRMHETVPGARATGSVTLDGQSLYGDGTSATSVRRHIGMVFQRPTPFPTMSIRDNVAAGLRTLGDRKPSHSETAAIVEDALRRSALWDEVKDRLNTGAVALSGGQQQRLCIARALANRPRVLLLHRLTPQARSASRNLSTIFARQ